MTKNKSNAAQISIFHYYLTKGVLNQSTDENVQKFIGMSEKEFVREMFNYAEILEGVYLALESNFDFKKVIESLSFWFWSEICITYKLPNTKDFLIETKKIALN